MTVTAPLGSWQGTVGFVPIGREITQSPMFTNRDFEALGVILALYLHAQFADGRMLYAPGTRIPVTLKRGQLLTSHRMLADMLDWSPKRVRTFLERAEREGLIAVSSVQQDRT